MQILVRVVLEKKEEEMIMIKERIDKWWIEDDDIIHPKRRNWKFLDTSIHIIHYLCMVILIITYIRKEVTTIERGRDILMVTPIEDTSLGQTHHLNIPDSSRIVPHTIRECKTVLFLYCLPNTLITFPFKLEQICYISSVWNK